MSKTSPAPDAPDLHQLVKEFNSWRKRRSHPRSPVPIHLRQQAVRLLPHHRKSHLVQALGVTPQMLKQWRDALSETEGALVESPFIAVTLSDEPVVSDALPVDLTLTLQHPNRIHIQGQLSLPQLTAVMRGLGVGALSS